MRKPKDSWETGNSHPLSILTCRLGEGCSFVSKHPRLTLLAWRLTGSVMWLFLLDVTHPSLSEKQPVGERMCFSLELKICRQSGLWLKPVECYVSTEQSLILSNINNHFQGSDSWAEAPGKHQPITIHVSYHQQSSGALHHPCLWKRAWLSTKASASQQWTWLNFNFICSPLVVLHFTSQPVYIQSHNWNCPLSVQKCSAPQMKWFYTTSLFSFPPLQISGITGHQPGFQLPLQLCNALASCPPGPHQYLPYHGRSASHCLHAQSDTSSLCRPRHIVRSAGLSTTHVAKQNVTRHWRQ